MYRVKNFCKGLYCIQPFQQKLFIFFLSFFLFLSGSAQKIAVKNGNNDGPGSLRAAIAMAPDGAVIYFERAVTVQLKQSQSLIIAKDVTIDGRGSTIKGKFAPLFVINENRKVLLKNISFRNDKLQAGAFIQNKSNQLSIQNCNILTIDAAGDSKNEKKQAITGLNLGELVQNESNLDLDPVLLNATPGEDPIGGGSCTTPLTWFFDADGDGYGNSAITVISCQRPSDKYKTIGGDCNDSDPTVYPFATEVCDGKDNDCDGSIDENIGTLWYRDADNDGFGNAALSLRACTKPAGYVADATDCNDQNQELNPQTIWYKDSDKDGYSDGKTIISCGKPQVEIGKDGLGNPIIENYVLRSQLVGPSLALDCNDKNSSDFPGAPGSSCLVTCPLTNILYVKADATGTGNGSSWANAFTRLQDALYQACPGITQIWVAKGTYYPDEGAGKTNNDRNASFALKNNVAIYGGFAGTETQLNQRNITLNTTILSGDIDKNDGVNFSNNSGNSYHVIFNTGVIDTSQQLINAFTDEIILIIDSSKKLNQTAVLDGFTIRGGNANYTGIDPVIQKNGGGMLNISASPVIRNCVFTANTTTYNGGGVFNEDAQPLITGCTFSGNNASVKGGGIFNTGYMNWKITNCRFIANTNGGVYNMGMLDVVNTEFSRNTGTGFENGQQGVESAYAKLVNCSFSLNGSSVLNNYSDIEIFNSISDKSFANNSGSDPEGPLDPVYVFTIRYSLAPGIGGSNNNLSANPLFVDPANDNLRLQSGSPAIDAGLNSANTEQTDLANNARISGTIDMGAYEFGSKPCPSGNIIYVNKNATGANNGTTWADAYISLQDALANTCSQITQIWVAKGTYYPDEGERQTNNSRNASFIMKSGIAIYGGFAGNETTLNQRNWSVNATIISGDIDQNDNASTTTANLSTDVSRSNNSYHVIRNVFTSATPLLSSAILDGFIISDGNANGTNPDNSGGGMLNVYASPVVKNCVFTRNTASNGGGMYNQNAGTDIIQCIFKNNSAVNIGGGIGNSTVSSTLKITNSTFNGNIASAGGGIGNAFATPVITNCILFGNTAPTGLAISDQSAASTTTYSLVEFNNGVFPGTGNLNVNPLFVNAAAGDFRLQATSPAINKGNNTAISETLDFSGIARKIGVVDMGAYEFENSCNINVITRNITAQIDAGGIAVITAAQINNGSTGTCGPLTFTLSKTSFFCNEIGKNTIVLTATDANGNTDTAWATVTVEDKVAPTVITRNITAQIDSGGIAVITPAMVDNGSFDACGIQSYSLSRTQFFCNFIGANTVTLTITDVNGNTSSGTAIVTVEDKIAPVVITKNIKAQIDAGGVAVIADRDVDNGSYDPCGLVSYKLDKTRFDCSNIGPNTVTLTVTDANGNTASATAVVTVEDKVAPTIITRNITAQIDAGGVAVITPAMIDNGSFDACGIQSLTLNQTTFFCSNIGSNTVTLTVTDVNGNTASATAIVSVEDNVLPTVITKNITVQLGADGTITVGDRDVDNGSFDACGLILYQISKKQFTCNDIGDNIVTLTVKDANGNEAFKTATITVQGTKPVWYKDADNDGYSDGTTLTQCTQPVNYKLASALISISVDCNDGNAAINPATVWYKDADNDGYSDGTTLIQCTQPANYKLASALLSMSIDCNDSNPAINIATVWYKDADNDGYSDGTTVTQCTRPVNYKLASELISMSIDCDDNNNTLNRSSLWYKDADNDGYNDGTSVIQCTRPLNYKLLSELIGTSIDCNDNNAAINPGTVWYKDADNDGFSDGTTRVQCAQPFGYKLASALTSMSIDCNDANSAVKPGAVEICDGIDNNCNGQIDEGVQTTFYRDADGDSFGNPAITIQACSAPVGYVTNNTDCNDANSAIKPGAVEICDGIDNNCNGLIDEGVQTIFYRDADGDSFGNPAITIQACSAPVGYVTSNTDCNDANSAVKPGAVEICDGIDNNCNGQIDEGVQTTFYRDADGDGFGNPAITIQACSAPVGYVTNNTDCNDANSTVKPGAVEICDGIDNNCNGLIDEGVQTTFYRDADGDGFGNPAVTTQACTAPTGFVTNNTDCNDANSAVKPGAVEICDGIDNNCNGQIDEGVQTTFHRDADGDSFGNPAITIQACSAPVGYVTNNTDCNDSDAAVFANRIYFRDADGDGYGISSVTTSVCSAVPPAGFAARSGDCNDNNPAINPGVPEICGNRIDDNCNGQIDEISCAPCGNASSLTTTGITSTSAQLNWVALVNPVEWQLQYISTAKRAKAVTVTVSGNLRSVVITGLTVNQTYQWQIRAKCGNKWTSYSSPVTFTATSTQILEAKTEKVITPTFEVITAPNPSDSYFTLSVKSSNTTDRILVRVMDELGRVVEQQENVMSGTTIRFGDKYIPGMYFIMVQQGKNSKAVKLIRR